MELASCMESQRVFGVCYLFPYHVGVSYLLPYHVGVSYLCLFVKEPVINHVYFMVFVSLAQGATFSVPL